MSADREHPGLVDRLMGRRPIRWKLAIGFGVILLLGAVNIGIYNWGSHRRSNAWDEVQRAIERQVIVTDVLDQLGDQETFVELLSGVIGVQGGRAPSKSDQESFAQTLDAITARLAELRDLVDPARAAAVDSLYQRTIRLTESWKRFYTYQWTDPSRAISELYTTAEPLAEEVLGRDLPRQVELEQASLSEISERFVRTDRTFGRIAWVSFIISALLGGALAFVISRDLLRSISALRTGTERIGAGDLDHRISVRSGDELGEVAESFNDMTRRLKERTDELAAQRDQIEAQRDDLTRAVQHLRATQAQLVQQEKLASLGALTAGIAHEIKNPLNFINNFASLCEELADELRIELADERSGRIAENGTIDHILDDLKTNATKIREHGQRADAIVKSMLLHSRGQAGENREVDVNALLDEYVTLAFHGMRAQQADFMIDIERSYDPNVGRIEVVPQELGRVFINLLNNAFYAVQEKKAAAPPDYTPLVRVETKRRQAEVDLRISDNGTGIPEEVRRRIFEPFFTTKPTGEGTGLGLSMSYDIITQVHGGRLEVESTEGCGTTFHIILPAPQREAAGVGV